MIALCRKNIITWKNATFLALFAGCVIFSVSGRMNLDITFEQNCLSAVSDHYYLTYFALPIVLLSCFSFLEDDAEPVILRFQSYHSYFFKKWMGLGLIAGLITAVQTGAILLSGTGLPFGNDWNIKAGASETELFSMLEEIFADPMQAFACYTVYQFIGSWLIFGFCMWLGHFAKRKWTLRIVMGLYLISAVWIKLPVIQSIPLTSFNHLFILHHNYLEGFGSLSRFGVTAFTAAFFAVIIALSVRFAWRCRPPRLSIKNRGIAGYYLRALFLPRNLQVLLCVVLGVSIYKRVSTASDISGLEWIYTLFAGHGTGYFQMLPFLEMIITCGAPLYLLAVFVEQTVNGQSMFVWVRTKGRRDLAKSIISASAKFITVYTILWFTAGLVSTLLFTSGMTSASFRLLLYAGLMRGLDIFVQYLIMMFIYIATKQVTVGFLALLAGNMLCVVPGEWTAYLPFGISGLTRITVEDPDIGISAVTAFGIEASLAAVLIAGLLMYSYKKL